MVSKNARVLVVFHIASAVLNIPIGQGCLVIFDIMAVAFDLLALKLYCISCVVRLRKFSINGPNLPKGSSAKRINSIFVAISSPMVCSPFTPCGRFLPAKSRSALSIADFFSPKNRGVHLTFYCRLLPAKSRSALSIADFFPPIKII